MVAIDAYSYSDSQRLFDHIDNQFKLGTDALVRLTRAFLDEFELGLSSYNHPMAMIPTFVTGVPDGTETGHFLALDLGGTNLRVCEVILNGDQTFTLRQQKYKVSDALKTGEATALFDYLADSVDAFLTTHTPTTPPLVPGGKPQADHLNLGLTFSFPVEQTALGAGKILTWTKGFSAKHAIGKDVVQLLQSAFDRKHMHVKCVALVNDTVGALLSRAYSGGGCIAGAIFGTGTNGAYLERIDKIKKLEGTPAAAKGGYMVVNTEWGAFNNSRAHLPSTPYDLALDRLSINPRYQAFEKFVSGMYLGEVTRRVILSLLDAAPKALVFQGVSTPVLDKQWGLDTSVMSEVEEAFGEPTEKTTVPPLGSFNDEDLSADMKERLERVRAVVVTKLGFEDSQVSLRDVAIVRWASLLVARRAATLSGVAIAAVLVQTERAVLPGDKANPGVQTDEKINIGVDGSLIEHYPGFATTLREALRELVGAQVEQRVVIGMAKDGSGVGAALCALQASKQTA